MDAKTMGVVVSLSQAISHEMKGSVDAAEEKYCEALSKLKSQYSKDDRELKVQSKLILDRKTWLKKDPRSLPPPADDVVYGLALVVEDDGPRLVFRYSNRQTEDCQGDSLFETFEAGALAKLFCTRKALSGTILELEIDDILFLSCPTTITAGEKRSTATENAAAAVPEDDDEDDDEPAYWPREDDEQMSSRRVELINVVWVVPRRLRNEALEASLKATALDVSAALAHEEERCGYVSRESSKMAQIVDSVEAQLEVSLLARELRDACEIALSGRESTVERVQFNRWIDCGDLLQKRRQRTPPAKHAPYEALVLPGGDGDGSDDGEDDSSSRTLPSSGVSPQLRLLVRAAKSPRISFATIAKRTGIPLERVYDLASHLVASERARVVSAVNRDSVFSVDPQCQISNEYEAALLSEFGTGRRYDEVVSSLYDKAFLDADAIVQRLLSQGKLKQLHTYVHLLHARTDDDVASIAGLLDPLESRLADDMAGAFDAEGIPATVQEDELRSVTYASLFKSLCPLFDGTHSLQDIAFKKNVDYDTICEVLDAFKTNVVRVQR